MGRPRKQASDSSSDTRSDQKLPTETEPIGEPFRQLSAQLQKEQEQFRKSSDLKGIKRKAHDLNRSLKESIEDGLPETMRRAFRYGKTHPYPRIDEAIAALRADDPEPFFRLLGFMPGLLTDKEIWRLTVGQWFPRKLEDPVARKNLKRLGEALAWTGKGKVSEQSPREGREKRAESNRQANRKRKNTEAAQRLVQQYEHQKTELLHTGASEATAAQNARQYVSRQFQRTSSATNKDAILKIFYSSLPRK